MSTRELVGGWVIGHVERSIASLIPKIIEGADVFPFCLLTSLDSSTDLSDVAFVASFVANRQEASFLDGQLLLPTHLLSVWDPAEMFVGFDELWLFRKRPSAAAPVNVCIKPPFELGEAATASRVTTWMSNAGAVLGLGDGAGMNFIAADHETGAQLERWLEESDEID